MATQKPIRLPKLSASMTEATIIAWLKKEGDNVRKGEPIAQIETDKATGELESPEAGVLIAIRQGEGARVPVNTIIAFVEE